MSRIEERPISLLAAVSNAMVRLHKEQFGRGPTSARSNFAGPDTLVCVLHEALLPAELKLVKMGNEERVRESRLAFQVGAADEFIKAVEMIVGRTVSAFASAIDVEHDVVFENFFFVPEASGNGNGPS